MTRLEWDECRLRRMPRLDLASMPERDRLLAMVEFIATLKGGF